MSAFILFNILVLGALFYIKNLEEGKEIKEINAIEAVAGDVRIDTNSEVSNKIEAPAINMVSGFSFDSENGDVYHLDQSVRPGNTGYSMFVTRNKGINKLKKGDVINLYISKKEYRYKVIGQEVIGADYKKARITTREGLALVTEWQGGRWLVVYSERVE